MAKERNECGPIRERYMEGLKETSGAVRSYWLNYAFLDGQQWVFYNRATNQLSAYQEDDRIRPTFNRLRSNFRTLMGMATQRALTFEVLPTSSDDHSLKSARLSERLLAHLHDTHGWESMREINGITTFKGGTAAIAVDWDPDAKTSIETPLSIAEFVIQPGVRDGERAVWWVKAQALPPAEVRAMFDLKELPPADAMSGMNSLQERLFTQHHGDEGSSKPDLTLVLTYYERPNKVNPKGCFKVEVNNQLVQVGEWNFPWKDRLNLVVTRETPQEDRWYGSTIINDCRPVQVAMNLAWANLLEHLADAGAAKLLVPQSAIQILEMFTDLPGEMIPYPDGQEKPDYLNPPQLAAWIRDMPGMIQLVLDDLMGVHDVSRGQAPSNIESGLGLSILAEKDSTPVGRFIKETAGAWARLAGMVLQLHQQEVRETRTSVVETEGGPLKFEWTGKDLGGQTNVSIPQESIMPRSRAAMQAFADNAMQMGLIKSIDEYAKIAELPGGSDMVSVVLPDVSKAQRENSDMANGKIVLPATFDDHALHIEHHNRFRKTELYELLPESLRIYIDKHVKAHELFAAEAMGQMVHQAMLDPNLALSPSAEGTPPPEVLPGAPAPEGQEAVPGQEDDAETVATLDPEARSAEVLNAIQSGGGDEAP